jgi:YVTN family beta-propeller protein
MNVTDVLTHAGVDPEFAELGVIPIARGPISDMGADPDGATLVVANYGDDSVSFIDAGNRTADATVLVGGEPLAIAVADNRAYVATTSASYDSVAVIDTDTRAVIAACVLDYRITSIAVDPDGKRVYVGRAGRDAADLAVIDVTAEEVSTIELATAAGGVVDAVRVSPDNRRVYAAISDTYGAALAVVDADAARVIETIRIGAPIRDLAVGPDGHTVYVLTSDPARGGAIDTVDLAAKRIVAGVGLGGNPTQMTLSPDGTRAYVVDRDHVAVICTVTHEWLDSITFGAQPSCVVASPDAGLLYVADNGGAVSVLAVEAANSVPCFQVMATELIGAPELRELEPAAV